MATSTTPDNIYLVESTDQITPLETTFNQISNSVQTSLNKREGYTYRWDSLAEQNAETGMRNGDWGYRTDTNEVYKRTGSAWKLWEKPETTYTPVATNLTVGTGGSIAARYCVSGGMVFVQIVATLGSSGFTVGDVQFSTPVAQDTSGMSGTLSPLGTANLYDSSATTTFLGQTAYVDANTVRIRRTAVSGTNIITANITSALPFTWAAGDRIYAWFNYRISI